MLSRLNFELAERQRYMMLLPVLSFQLTALMSNLDIKHKELLAKKEALLQESKAKATTADSVKQQIDTLMKVGNDLSRASQLGSHAVFVRLLQMYRRRLPTSYKQLHRHSRVEWQRTWQHYASNR